jgi:hypothetical protein
MIGRIGCVAALVCGLAAGVDAGRDYRLEETTSFRHTLRFAGSGGRALVVRTLHGSIRVSGGSGEDVRLEARRTVRADSREELARGEREAVLTVSDQRSTVEAIVREPNSPACGEDWEGGWQRRPRYHVRYDFEVRVPQATRLVLCTINGDAIDVEGTNGDFQISNVNGRITIDRVRGSGSATTVNGPITASFLDIPRTRSEFRTTNGNVTATWPADLAADLRMKTFNGGLFTDFDVTPVATSATAAGERRNGRFVLKTNEFTTVRVGRGGPEVTLESFNGSVRVLRANR